MTIAFHAGSSTVNRTEWQFQVKFVSHTAEPVYHRGLNPTVPSFVLYARQQPMIMYITHTSSFMVT
ncbi:MAG: hypothetical protein L0H53_08990 [Candidatus Nitrosocosmicus sp.]|nr:hypothetical protein [Candidatus Nitrosocosmicus sp.]MDN5867970.1 hypothetical protein [Candidatus Nitrosocosmicus sp.]